MWSIGDCEIIFYAVEAASENLVEQFHVSAQARFYQNASKTSRHERARILQRGRPQFLRERNDWVGQSRVLDTGKTLAQEVSCGLMCKAGADAIEYYC